ncbi:OLC1v1037327C1 [Oldenlandia corymbosa var. corymbosa]|uniref:OLC1v1037327C1 n=1 Tax=Oldenlandia corymbosa var. corymbosa TaxID=529605 RepID=A0AAV1D0J0_OLDCO|nr:OLC1v1037327C1 [Oldenlandia corymbosa var. corymbosa]
MPQDGPRSIVYRSFFSCEDPKGVVECKTSRKTKTDSHKLDEKVGHPKTQKNLSRSFSWNGERNDTISRVPTDQELHSPSTFQLMQISRGAEKLNQVIDTWSKDISLEKHSKDIAENLLKGALDLKESLAMLGKLQEASQVMAKLKKKQKDKGGGAKLDGGGIERTMSDRFGYASQRTVEFENPRFSVDGSARDCFDELREVIKESFARQNLLPKSYNEEKPYSDRPKSEFLLPPSSPDMLLLPKSFKEEKSYFDRTEADFSWDPSYQNHKLSKMSKESKAKSDCSQDLPSTSSSQSSHYFSYEFDSSDSSISKSLETKPKAPNVIAKLMGLEDISPKRLQSHPQKHYGKEKALNQGRLIFDIDLPKARRPPFVQKLDQHPRTLEELTETVQFKGLLSSSSPRRFEHLSDISDWRKGFASDVPPIVIIKPLPVSELKEEALRRPKLEDLDEKMLRKRKVKSELPPRPHNDREGALKSTEIRREVRAEKSPGKRPIQERASKDFGDAVARKGDKSIKRQENPHSAMNKASSPLKPRNQKKEVSQKMVNRNRKAIPNSSKPTEDETKKYRDASKALQSTKLKSASARKSEKEPNFSNVQVLKDQGATVDTMAECLTTSESSTGQKKNVGKEEQASELSEISVESEICSDDFPVDPVSQTVPDVTENLIIPSQQITGGEEKDIYEDLVNCNKSAAYPGDSSVILLLDSEFKEGAGNSISFYATDKKRYERNNTMRNLLLGSTSFVNHAEELFDIHSHRPTYSHTTSLHEYETDDSEVLLECAKELLGNRCLQCNFGVHPVPNTLIKESKIWIPLDQLVDEICDGIEYLRSYYKLGDKGLIVHKLHTVLQKDMWGKGVVTGAWDFGWSKGFTTPDEIDEVVVNIEHHILSDLFDDMLRDLAV